MKLYIAILDEFPDYMTPTLVAHAMLGAHLCFSNSPYEDGVSWNNWLNNSFKKCVVRVTQTEFDKIAALPNVYLGYENNTLDGRPSCAVVCPREEIPKVLQFAKLWKPNHYLASTATSM
jgi:hypothetical protein